MNLSDGNEYTVSPPDYPDAVDSSGVLPVVAQTEAETGIPEPEPELNTEASPVAPEVSPGSEAYTGMKLLFARHPDIRESGKRSTSAPFLPWNDQGRYGRMLINKDWPPHLVDLLEDHPLSEKGKLTRLGLLLLAEYEHDCSTRVGVFLGKTQVGVNEINPPACQKKDWPVRQIFERILDAEKLRQAKELFGVKDDVAHTAISEVMDVSEGDAPASDDEVPPSAEAVMQQALADAEQRRQEQDGAISLVANSTFDLLAQTQRVQNDFAATYLATMEAQGVQLGVQGFNTMMRAASGTTQELMKRAAASQQPPGKQQPGGSGASSPPA